MAFNNSSSFLTAVDSLEKREISEESAADVNGGDLVSYEIRVMIEYVVDIWVTSFLIYIGTIGNTMAIVVFIKQGFEENINISMMAISVWELLKCVTGAGWRLYAVAQLFSPGLGFTWWNIAGFTLGNVQCISIYVSGNLAGYVSIERCLCVSMPFTVKFLLTRKVATTAVIAISAVTSGALVAMFSTLEIQWLYSPVFNETVAYVLYNSIHYQYPAIDVYVYIMSTIYPVLTFLVILVCTVVISYHLHKASKFRSSVGGGEQQKAGNTGQLSARDRQVLKMLLVIIIIFLVNFTPRVGYHLLRSFIPDFNYGGQYENVFFIFTAFNFLLTYVNAMSNPIIFFFMSSTFRATFMETFCSFRKRKNK